MRVDYEEEGVAEDCLDRCEHLLAWPGLAAEDPAPLGPGLLDGEVEVVGECPHHAKPSPIAGELDGCSCGHLLGDHANVRS